MAHLQYFTYPDFGVVLGDQSYYSQAVRIGDRIECSGQRKPAVSRLFPS